MFTGQIVGYSISDRMKAHLAVNSPNFAMFKRRDATGCIVQLDCGSQFRSRKIMYALNRHHPLDRWGKSALPGTTPRRIPSFRATEQHPGPQALVDLRGVTDREELRISIITWIKRTHHRRRQQVRLGRLMPIEHETIMNATVSLAA